MALKQIILLLLGSLMLATHSFSQESLPKNLDEAVLFLQKHHTKKELESFANEPENKAVSDWYWGTGLWIRNNWIRGNRDSALVSYFHLLGKNNPDYISSIILTALHRKLNKQNINTGKPI